MRADSRDAQSARLLSVEHIDAQGETSPSRRILNIY